MALGVLGCRTPTAPNDEVGTSGSTSGASNAIVDLTNAERSRAGLPVLQAEARLNQAAQLHADQLVAAGRLEHTLPGARYPRLEDRIAAVGYDWRAIGENLASGQSSAAQAVTTWMSSPGHRANIMNTTFTEIGASIAFDGGGRPYYVQVFGARR
jgi:uncharacterized protein YkwD